MQSPSRSSHLKELKEKYLELYEMEEVLEEILEHESHQAKLPKRMQDKPKTVHHPDHPPVISDSIL